METRVRYELQSYLDDLRRKYEYQVKEFSNVKNYASMRLKRKILSNGSSYYYLFDDNDGNYHYLGSEENANVGKIKTARFFERSLFEIDREIRLIEDVLEKSRATDYHSINSLLCKAYQDADLPHSGGSTRIAREWKAKMSEKKKRHPLFCPEGLIHSTRDGNKTRSKGEALIYNYLLDIGVTFIYELPLGITFEGKSELLLPDFTILSEIDFKSVIYIEHQGMMKDYKYRSKFNDSVYKYWSNNYIPGRDVFFTFDLPNGAYDDAALKSIITRFVRPSA